MKYTRYNKKRKINLLKPALIVKSVAALGVIALVLAIPATILLTRTKTETRSNASASTTLSFSQATPQVNTGDTLSMDVMMNPGTNAISFVKLVISYDNSQVQPTVTGLVPNNTAFPQILDGPTYNTCSGTSCTMSVQLSIGNNPTNAIIAPTKAATVNFTITGSNAQTQIAFDGQTQILSIAPSDSPSENVLSTSTPANITIGNISNFTPSPTSSQTTSPTPTTSGNPTPPQGGSPTPTTAKSPTPTSAKGGNTPTPSPSNMCKGMHDDNDTDSDQKLKKAQNDMDNIKSTADSIITNNAIPIGVKKQFAQSVQQALDVALQNVNQSKQTIIGGNGKGGCLGAFDPNNPAAGQNCDNTPTAGSQSWWDAFTKFTQGLFGGTNNANPTPPTPTP